MGERGVIFNSKMNRLPEKKRESQGESEHPPPFFAEFVVQLGRWSTGIYNGDMCLAEIELRLKRQIVLLAN